MQYFLLFLQRTAKKIFFVVFIQFFWMPSLLAMPIEEEMRQQFSQEQKGHRLINYEQRVIIPAQAFKAEAKTIYELSMPLLADPRLYQPTQFEKLLKETETTAYAENSQTSWMSSEEFRLWMKGRQLLIVMHTKKYKGEAREIAAQMDKAITPSRYKPTGEYGGLNTAVACWSLGYLQAYNALYDNGAYEKTKERLKQAVQYQRSHYDELGRKGAIKEQQAFYSDMMWSYTMAIQAAAWKEDKRSYDQYMQGLAELKGNLISSIRALSNNQFPAWLTSIVYSSVVQMKDPRASLIYQELMKARQRTTKEEDKMLGYATQYDYQRRLLIRDFEEKASFAKLL